MSSMTVSEARAALPEIVERVLAGEEITLTRHGVAVAVVVHPAALKVRRADAAMAQASAVQELLERGRRRPVGSGPGLSPERAERLVADVRAARARR